MPDQKSAIGGDFQRQIDNADTQGLAKITSHVLSRVNRMNKGTPDYQSFSRELAGNRDVAQGVDKLQQIVREPATA